MNNDTEQRHRKCRKDLDSKMSYYPPSENGTKVNMIKQKFEQNLSPKEKSTQPQCRMEVEEQKESLRRSLSASPVKTKRNFKLNVSRQLSNPGGKNIKRTPAFRGDKLSRTKNLQSPTKERLVSIVNQNVKIFEETPEYGKIGNVKKKTEPTSASESCSPNTENSSSSLIDWKSKTSGNATAKSPRYIDTWKDLKPGSAKAAKINDNNTVRTTVISRQKNISPIYTRDDELVDSITNGKSEFPTRRHNNVELEKFVKNGAEYTKVTKPNKFSFPDDKATKSGKVNAKRSNEIATGILDVREELSRRINRTAENNENFGDESNDVPDGEGTERIFARRKFGREELADKSLEEAAGIELTATLKAALQAPLPVGPPPKKPPRTFVHSPVNNLSSLEENKCRKATKESPISEERSMDSKKSKAAGNDKIENSRSRDSSRDSKKMLEKLEHVLIQHQKALGAKVIMPRKEKNEAFGIGDKIRNVCNSTSDSESKEKNRFHNRLSRTLEDSKKLGSLPKVPGDSKTRKHSTFECLPSLNCATWTSIYEQVKDPDFKSYFAETLSLRESKSSISKSEDSLDSSMSNILTGNTESDFRDEPAAKRLSTELSTFLDGKKRLVSGIKSEERVYAEPFAFDKNSGTDITGYGMLTSDQHNYFSRSLQEERFGKSNENFMSFNDQRDSSERLSRSDDTDVAKPGLHYMCTSIQPMVYEDNNNELEDDSASSKIVQRGVPLCTTFPKKNLVLNVEDCHSARAEPDKLSKIKVEQLLNQAFGKFTMAGSETPTDSNNSSDTDSLASSPSISDQLSSFNDKLRLFKNRENGEKPTKDELHRSLTEKRKNYVRRVSSKFSERREGGSLVCRRDKLFQVCLLVELNLSTREPYIKDKYPVYAKTPAWIENFCFPDATDWPPSDSNQNQFYSLVLMDERGNRRYGYCCRVRPEDGPILPLAYCLITKYRASGFYQKVLRELESRHGLPDRKRTRFIEELYNSPMPKPGQSLRLTVDDKEPFLSISSTADDEKRRNKNVNYPKLIDSNDKFSGDVRQKSGRLTAALLTNERTISEKTMDALIASESAENVILRSGDPRLEERDMSQLFDAVSNKVLIVLFGSLLLERKVVLLCNKLSKLSSCVDALQSLLYPFTWPHTFIPVLPDIPGLSEILQAPLPFVIGILKSKNSANTDVAAIRDGIVVDLDTSKIVYAVGDESSILPSRLQKGIRSALQLVHSHTKSGDGIRNFLVSEAFLRILVETCSHCDSHLVTQQDGKVIFQKESFIKASSSSKNVQYFLEWFVETTMFTCFIQDCISRMEDSTSHDSSDAKLFYQRAAEFRKRAEKNGESKNGCSKKKTLGDRLKDLTNFHT